MMETSNPGLSHIESELRNRIGQELDRIGIHYRLFSRVKSAGSLKKKIEGKGHYSIDGKKVQDLIGFRVITYFIDDVNILWDHFYGRYEVVDDQYDSVMTDTFKPLRKNMICRLPKEETSIFNENKVYNEHYKLVDSTFEIQFRTTFSEGWHEVDHLLRYKCKEDWENYDEEGRMFNGVFAASETNDRALKALFDDMSYNHYKKGNWIGMLRMKFRLQFSTDAPFSLQDLFKTTGVAKKVFRFNRIKLLGIIAKSGISIPINFDNIVFLIIYLEKIDGYQSTIPVSVIDEFRSCSLSNFRDKH